MWHGVRGFLHSLMAKMMKYCIFLMYFWLGFWFDWSYPLRSHENIIERLTKRARYRNTLLVNLIYGSISGRRLFLRQSQTFLSFFVHFVCMWLHRNGSTWRMYEERVENLKWNLQTNMPSGENFTSFTFVCITWRSTRTLFSISMTAGTPLALIHCSPG